MAVVNGELVEFLTAGRAAHAQLLVDSAVIARVTNGALNRTTHQYPTTPVTVYTGPARFKRTHPFDRTLADRAVEETRPIMDLPWTVTGAATLQVGDVITATSQDASFNGRTLKIIGPAIGTTNTAHRYLVEEIDS